jgi:hypothetical protein
MWKVFLKEKIHILVECGQNGILRIVFVVVASIYVYTKSMRKGYTRCEGSSNPRDIIAHVYMDSNARYRYVPFSHHVRIPYAQR